MRYEVYIDSMVAQEQNKWYLRHGMRKCIVIRNDYGDDGTFGDLVLDDGTLFCTGELPWRNNEHGISCIPLGIYVAKWFNSPKHGWCYMVYGVKNREGIEIHSANWMGDVKMGYFNQLEGCIALGMSIGILTPSGRKPQKSLLQSKDAVTKFDDNLGKADLAIQIVNR